MDLSGLAFVGGGYRKADDEIETTRLKRQKGDAGDLDIQAQDAMGRGGLLLFNSPMPGAMPMTPSPGQPSVPLGGQGPPQGGPPPGGPPGMPPQGTQMGGGPPPQPPPQMPLQGPPGGGMQPSGQGPPGTQPPGQQGPVGGPHGFSLQQWAQAIARSNPGIERQPRVFAAALDKAIPLMNAQAQAQWREERMHLMQGQLEERRRHQQEVEDIRREAEAGRGERAEKREAGLTSRTETRGRQKMEQLAFTNEAKRDMLGLSSDARKELELLRQAGQLKRTELTDETRKEIAKLRSETQKEIFQEAEQGREGRSQRAEEGREGRAQRAEEGRTERAGAAEAGRESRFGRREERLDRGALVRQDQSAERIRLQREALEQRIGATKDRSQLAQWRALLDAEHKRATEVIQAHSINTNMTAKERDKLLAEQRTSYQEHIDRMKSSLEGKGKAKETSADQPPPEALKNLKEGQVTVFQNGQKWTLKNGKPEKVE